MSGKAYVNYKPYTFTDGFPAFAALLPMLCSNADHHVLHTRHITQIAVSTVAVVV
jgi:hypothetical protein